MNCKTTKRIRKSIGYHPSDPRKYVAINATIRKRKDESTSATIIVDPTDKRALYQEIKKETYDKNN